MSGSVIALYFWPIFDANAENFIGETLLISTPAVMFALAAFLVSFVSWLWAPRNTITPFALTIYYLTVATTIVLVLGTGGFESPFMSLWMLVAMFSGVFGIWGIAPLLAIVNTQILVLFLNGGHEAVPIVTAILAGELPIVASYLIWNNWDRASTPKRDPQAYKQLATELSEVAGKSEVVINAIGDGVLAIDSQGVIQIINPAAQQLLGWSKRDAMTLNYRSVLQLRNKAGDEITDQDDPIQHVLNSNQEERTSDLAVVTKSDKKMFISIVVSPVGQSGSGVIVVFRDITKEKAEEREQAEFISTASHEMRTPVASIEGYLGLALNPNTAAIDDKAREYIQKAQESVKHLGRLFQDLLDVSKAEDGRLSNNPRVIDIVTFTSEVIEGLQQRASEKGLRLTFKPGNGGGGERTLSPVYYVHLDTDHIREIVNNLTENAIKYTPSGEVSVDIEADDDRIILSVKDSGIGIATEDIPHLFQKFYRVDNSDTREIGGTGLGLYLCRRLAEALGGRIWVESVYKQGSTFFLELPRISTSEAERLSEEAGLRNTVEQNTFVANQVETPLAQPVVEPPQPQPAPSPIPQPTTPQQPLPPMAPVTIPTNNTPLSTIEQNPTAYAWRQRSAMPAARSAPIPIPTRSTPKR